MSDHTFEKLMGNCGLNGGVPWRTDTDVVLCFICETEVEGLNQFVANCPNFKDQFVLIWTSKISVRIPEMGSNCLKHQEGLQWLLGPGATL